MGTSSQRSRRRRRPSTKTAAPDAKRSPLLLNSGEARAAAALAGFVILFVAIALLATGGTGYGGTSTGGAPADDAAAIAPDDGAATSDAGAATDDEQPTAAATDDEQPTAAATDDDQPTATAIDDYQPTASDEEAIRTLARKSIEVLPAGQWPSLYDSFTSEFQLRCPREEFDQAGVDAAVELGADLRLLRFIRLESLTMNGSSAQAVITGEIAGQDEYQVQVAFQREDSAWKIAPLPGTQGCQAFLAS